MGGILPRAPTAPTAAVPRFPIDRAGAPFSLLIMCINMSGSSCGKEGLTKGWPCRLTRMGSAIAVLLLLALSQVIAQTLDDQYLRIYGIIEQGDALLGKGQTNQALAKYREADLALQGFQKGNRDWNPKLIAYRFRYLAQQIETLSAAVDRDGQHQRSCGHAGAAVRSPVSLQGGDQGDRARGGAAEGAAAAPQTGRQANGQHDPEDDGGHGHGRHAQPGSQGADDEYDL